MASSKVKLTLINESLPLRALLVILPPPNELKLPKPKLSPNSPSKISEKSKPEKSNPSAPPAPPWNAA